MMLSDKTVLRGRGFDASREYTDPIVGSGLILAGFSLGNGVLKALFALFVLSSTACALSQNRSSPFERASNKVVESKPQAQVAPSRLDKMEFTGLLAFGGEITISLYDTAKKESLWVPLEGSQDGISISGFDEETGMISVSLQGVTRKIAINENEIVAITRAEPVAAPMENAPPKPVRVKDDETLLKEEEARLFVSDLLASGLQRREKFRREREARSANAKRIP